MDQDIFTMGSEVMYPILLLPKVCTNLETNCEVTDNVFIDLNITSPDTEGNNTCIYSGFCNIKLIDTYDVNIQDKIQKPVDEVQIPEIDDQLPVIIADQPSYNQNQVWIDPTRSPFVYNHYGVQESKECYSVCHQSRTSIMVEQCNTYITKNVYNYKEAIHYSNHEEYENSKPKKQALDQQISEANNNNYEDDEFECGVFLSQLPEEIMIEKQNKAKEERKFIGLESENSALKQLMSPGIQSMSKQRKTILFLGPDSQCGQTIQQIAYYDPAMECSGGPVVDNEVVIDDTDPPRQKRYQCANCHQIFDQIADFRDHMVNHTSPKYPKCSSSRNNPEVRYICAECGKNLKTREKFERHCMGHGDPDLECNKCHKVFASKFTLRAHRKIHTRKFPCAYCTKTYSNIEEMRAHAAKVHFMFMCEHCEFVADKHSELTSHLEVHVNNFPQDSSETEFAESIFGDVMSEDDVMRSDPDWKLEDEEPKSVTKYDDNDRSYEYSYKNYEDHDNYDENDKKYDEIQRADSVIAKVMSNKMFLAGKNKKHRRYRKICDVCLKSFDRVSDLKRHLIEHIVRSTLAKSPATRSGTLTLHCEVCQAETFTKIDRYKAHLREHAKLTLYKCTFCNKSFSDSSNFSKHKKIHGATYFQCDLCQRKFNSKKMITRHMEFHNDNQPMSCLYCDKQFHFESMLNKHIKSAHTKEVSCRFRCRFCHDYFKTLKEKWDHEWAIHNVRKMIVDCLICGAKFRKYAELKRHCADRHNVEIPTAKKLLKKKSY
ncbi:hypothetical protein O0L34_g13864 [Tuta absoluta]|nr:hypothetical protein O0L34_g13864 [Tuta absoluta]